MLSVSFQCPKCKANLKAPSEKIGARSKCNRCATPVVVPDPEAVPPPVPRLVEPQPMSQGIPVEPEDDGVETSSTPLMRAVMGVFWLIDLVWDIRFKRYLTPYIIQAAWILLILCCIGGFLLSRFAMPVIEAMEERVVRSSMRRQPPNYEYRSYQRVEPNPVADWIAGTIIYIIGSVMLLMAARVAGESIMVIFNISSDLKSVKRHLKSEPGGMP